MLIISLIVVGAVVGTALALRAFAPGAKNGSKAVRQEEYLPHDCLDGSFTTGALARPIKLDGSGKTLWVFDGLYCERCGRELGCVRCGKVPEAGAVVEEMALTDAVACCGRPMYRVRAAGRTISPDRDGPDPKDKLLN